jgi:mannose/fructose/N-acetylgalactosamine-specific phosphotransferase system component IID
MTTLAAHGDRLFWGNLKPLAATLGVLGSLCWPGAFSGAILAFLAYNIPNIYVRMNGFNWGFNEGLASLERFKSAKYEKRIEYIRLTLSLCLGLITGLLLWQCYQNQFKLFGNFYSLLSILGVGISGLTGFVAIKTGISVTKVTCPVAFLTLSVFGLLLYWIGNP